MTTSSDHTTADQVAAILARIGIKNAAGAMAMMPARKSSARKIRLIRKTKQSLPVPTWVILKTKRRVRTNPKRRGWRAGHTEVG